MTIGYDFPVSVIIRTIGRECLGVALDSIAQQTYRRIEVVVVNAACRDLNLPESIGEGLPLHLASPESPLKRSAAANFGLLRAKGTYLLFLDDDDWLHPKHVERLVNALTAAPDAILAYAGVECVQAEGEKSFHVFDEAFSSTRLLAENYIPIHAALFRGLARDRGCRFEEALDLHEDWDFWLQLMQMGEFIHCPGVSASYLMSEQGSGIWRDEDNVRSSLLRIYEKWWHCWTPHGTLAYLQSLRKQLTSDRHDLDLLHGVAAEKEQLLRNCRQEVDALHLIAADKEQLLCESRQEVDALHLIAAEKEQLLCESRQEIDALHQKAAKNIQQLQAALDESIRYATSLREHLSIKESELKLAHKLD